MICVCQERTPLQLVCSNPVERLDIFTWLLEDANVTLLGKTVLDLVCSGYLAWPYQGACVQGNAAIGDCVVVVLCVVDLST